MSLSDIVIIALSLLSLLSSFVATFFAIIVTKEAQKKKAEKREIEALARIREASRLEVSRAEIEAQLDSIPKKGDEQIFQVKAKRRFPNSSTSTKSTKIAGL